MKTLPLLILLALVRVPAAGAATRSPSVYEPGSAGFATPDANTVEPSEVPPHRGMTEAQVRKLYGDPDNQRGDAQGVTWFYFFNRAYYFIPFYYAKPRTAWFRFNEAGVLVDFRYIH
jgi:hypothetical protein